MEIKFGQKDCKCLHHLVSNVQNQEEIQEVKIPEGMPDIGNVLGAWGQAVLRSKQWHGNELEVSGGATIWALYLPESEDTVQCIECWIPFQMRWNIPAGEQDGIINAACYLRFADARTASSRKLIFRAGFSVSIDAYVPRKTDLFSPDHDIEGLQLLKNHFAVCLPKESGEKSFALDETLTMPATSPEINKILRYDVRLEVTDKKILSQKLVFRGSAILGILYCDNDGNVYHWDFELPFSQYTDLDNDYDGDAFIHLNPAITGVELDKGEDGTIHIKAGAVGQYTVFCHEHIEAVQDAYSLTGVATPQYQELSLPALLNTHEETLHLEEMIQASASRIVDANLCLDAPSTFWENDKLTADISGSMQVLYYDNDAHLKCEKISISEKWGMNVSDNADVKIAASASGIPQFSVSTSGINIRTDVFLNCAIMSNDTIDMISAIELGDDTKNSVDRPSVILRTVGDDDLWMIAKKNCSTVEAIMKTNNLQGEPNQNQILIVPVL